MRFTFTTGLGDYSHWRELAQCAEAAGFHAFSIPDSTIYTRDTESEYLYNDTELVRQYAAVTPFIDPMIAFTWMAAATSRIRFWPNVMKVPIRSPILLAKQLSSLAVLSGDRITLGAGVGMWIEDYRFNNIDWSRRGALLDDCITIIRGLLTGEFFEFHSDNFDIEPTRMNPAPGQPIPVLFGGHSPAALRRAARTGDGWVSVHGDADALRPLIARINTYRDEYGTADQPFEFHAGSFDFTTSPGEQPTLDDYRRLADFGITDYCYLPFKDPNTTLQKKIDNLRRFGDDVIGPVNTGS